ncbi:MFS transporter [Streptomyces chilikensis]|uniref:MFS transporter n=1 Tax=Streptomyces chilikensis TaxID=1194079 RepID=UPI003B84B45B
MSTAEPARTPSRGASVETPRIRVPAPAGRPAAEDLPGPVRPPRTPGPATAPAPVPGRAARFLRHPATAVTVLAGALHVLWFFTFANSGGDLAAQDAWAEFVGRNPDSAYNMAWYGGMHPVSYSVVSPYLMHVLGVRTTMMLSGTLSAGLLTLILCHARTGPVPRPGPAFRHVWPAALAGVLGLFCNAVSGRVTFGLGVLFALATTAVVFCPPRPWHRRRWAKALCAAPLAALATMASPVAGLFLGLIAVALFLQRRLPGAWALGLGPALVVAVSAWLFPFSGTQPMGFTTTLLPVTVAVLVYAVTPAGWRTVRITCAVYAAAVLLVWAVSSQIGSNITRLPMLFGGVALLAVLPFTEPRSRRRHAVLLSFTVFAGWVGVSTVNDVVSMKPDAIWARNLAPLVDRLKEADTGRGRVEVVPASSHAESSALVPHVNLARGWNRQADRERNPLFYDGSLDAATYREWLSRWAVHHVVLPLHGEPDGEGGRRERALIEGGLPYLKEVWADGNWRMYAVTDPTPLADPPARVVRADEEGLVLRVPRPGRYTVRVAHSPWLGLLDAGGAAVPPPEPDGANAHGCLAEGEEDAWGVAWTVLDAPAAGTYRLAAHYRIPRGTPCPEPESP